MRDECYTFAILEDENTLFFSKEKGKKRKGQLRTEQEKKRWAKTGTEGTQVAHTQFLRTIIHAWPTSWY
jgi:hypothetical protein